MPLDSCSRGHYQQIETLGLSGNPKRRCSEIPKDICPDLEQKQILAPDTLVSDEQHPATGGRQHLLFHNCPQHCNVRTMQTRRIDPNANHFRTGNLSPNQMSPDRWIGLAAVNWGRHVFIDNFFGAEKERQVNKVKFGILGTSVINNNSTGTEPSEHMEQRETCKYPSRAMGPRTNSQLTGRRKKKPIEIIH